MIEILVWTSCVALMNAAESNTTGNLVIKELPNVDCKPHEQVIRTNHADDMPLYVKLHRCQGGTRPIKVCAPLDVETLSYYSYNGKQRILRRIENHTECHYKCPSTPICSSPYQVFDEDTFLDTCSCKCLVRDRVTCQGLKEWDKSRCMCRCSNYDVRDNCVLSRKFFNDTDCTCADDFIFSFNGFHGGHKTTPSAYEGLCGLINMTVDVFEGYTQFNSRFDAIKSELCSTVMKFKVRSAETIPFFCAIIEAAIIVLILIIGAVAIKKTQKRDKQGYENATSENLHEKDPLPEPIPV